MNRKAKALGLALVAACAISAIAASSASATGEKFTSDKTHTILSAGAVLHPELRTTAGSVDCAGPLLDEATMASTSVTEITATPTYSGCTGSVGGSSVTIRVTMTSCDYKFTSEIPEGQQHSQLHIECTTAGDEIDWEAKLLGVFVQCIKVPAQTPTGGGITYANGGTDHIYMEFTITGIKYTEAGGCGSNTNVNNGTLEGEEVVHGVDTEGNIATLSYP